MTEDIPRGAAAPPGWYLDGSGRSRWWDGAKWVDNLPPAQQVVWVPPPAPKTNGWGIASLIVGIFAVLIVLPVYTRLFGFVLGIFALALGVDGLRRSKKIGGGHGVSLAGTILAGLALLIGLFWIFTILSLRSD